MPVFLREYFPQGHSQNRMWCEGDVAAARRRWLSERTNNLAYLLEKRFSWMNAYIPADARRIVELGCGMGASRDFIPSPALVLTDYEKHPWVDLKVDALAMHFEDASVDVLIANNVIHHLAYPMRFFREAARVLKPGGRVLIQEINASLLMRVILTVMRHEGFSFLQDPFDESRPCNDPRDEWSANCAIPNLLFDDPGRFEREAPAFRVERAEFSEFLIFPLSGGVIARSPTVPLPRWALRLVDAADELLVRACPGVFALQRRIVLLKRPRASARA